MVALVKIGGPAAPALVNALTDPRSDLRANAAAALRQVLAADPSAAPNKHQEFYWRQQLTQVNPGMLLKDVLAILLPTQPPAERAKAEMAGVWSGQSGATQCRLDDYWVLTIYLRNFDHKTLIEPPVLERHVRPTWVKPPPDFTGTWVVWHVNGQKSTEIQYRNGQYDGTFTAYYDNGSKCVVQHFDMGVCNGLDTGWDRDGKKCYEGRYEGGKRICTLQR